MARDRETDEYRAKEEVRLVFFPPDTKNAYILAKVFYGKSGNYDYYAIILNDEDINRISEKLRDLYIPLGGRVIQSIRIPLYKDLIRKIRDITSEIASIKARRFLRNKHVRIRVIPEYLVFTIDQGEDQRTIIMLDLDPPTNIDNIPLSWGHKSLKGKLKETYCLVIGHRNYMGTEYVWEEADDRDVEEKGHVYRNVPCPIAKLSQESKAVKYFANICNRVHRCANVQSKKGRGMLYGTDIMEYILDSRSMVKSYVKVQGVKRDQITYVNLGTSSFAQLLRGVDVEVSLLGAKLGLRKMPRTYIGAFLNRPEFRFKSVVKATNALSIEIDARRVISHLYYWINNDELLKLYTALKLLILDKSNSYIPRPAEAVYSDPRVTVSRLTKIMEHYIEKPDDLISDLENYAEQLEKLSLNSTRIINYLETISIHTFAHIIYLGLLNTVNTDQETLGLIIKRKYSKDKREAENITDPFEYLTRKDYEIILYEKADTGLGYLTDKKAVDKLFEERENTGLIALRSLYERIDHRIPEQRMQAYESYKEYLNHLRQRVSQKAVVLIDKLSKLSNKLAEYTRKRTGKEYTLIPAWLVRYGINTYSLDEDSRKIIDSALWFILDLFFDTAWDVSFEDLVLPFECVYYDLVQYFTLSRRYAKHLINDLLVSKESFAIKNPLTVEAGRIYEKILAKHSREHAFYTPWIDREGLLLIRRLLADHHTRAIYLGIRDEVNLRELMSYEKIGKIKFFNLSKIYGRPLHDKLYANDECEIIMTSQNLRRTSLRRNIEGYSYSPKDCFIAHSLIGLSRLLYNSFTYGDM